MAVCLIAGGAGFLGSHLAEALLARGDTVVVVDNFSFGTPDNLSEIQDRVEVIPGDLRSLALVRRAMRGIDCVFHFAVPWGPAATGPMNAPAAGALGSWHLLLSARDAGCRRFVMASAGEVYGQGHGATVEETAPLAPVSSAAREALLAEQEAVSFARSFGLGLVRLRLFNVFGPRQGLRAAGPNLRRIIEAMLAGKRPVLYDHELGEHDLLYVDDAIRGCLLAADFARPDGRVYNIGSGRSVRTQELVTAINSLLGTEIPPLLAGPCSTGPRAPLPNVARARAELGFAADYDLDERLRTCVGYYHQLHLESFAESTVAVGGVEAGNELGSS
jgi:UDP-glucose 4-epimerase